jgi:hypothetical protein
MSEDPEEVLVHDYIPTARGVKERGVELPVGKQHRDRTRENGNDSDELT